MGCYNFPYLEVCYHGQYKVATQVRATKAMNLFFKELYGEGYWIPAHKGAKLAKLVQVFLLSYQQCAFLSAARMISRFQLVPKLHMLSHVGLRLTQDSKMCQWVRNPLAEAVQMQEDYVGRPSRVSRRVNARMVHERVILRALCATHLELLSLAERQRVV